MIMTSYARIKFQLQMNRNPQQLSLNGRNSRLIRSITLTYQVFFKSH